MTVAVEVARGPYPHDLLPEGGTALALFAAAYLGGNDVVHFAVKSMLATCVDTDEGRLDEMRMIYDDDWRFVAADAWQFAQDAAAAGEQWDVVSVDTFTGDATRRSLESIGLWCSLARDLVTVTIGRGDRFTVPPGWTAAIHARTFRASWLVLTRA